MSDSCLLLVNFTLIFVLIVYKMCIVGAVV